MNTTGAAAPRLDSFAELRPEIVLDALEGLGLRGDGRLLQLNSYENRVFMVHLENGECVVAKFYRGGRWTDGQILEEHALAHDWLDDEIPVAAPKTLSPDGQVPGWTFHVTGPRASLGLVQSPLGHWRVAVTDRLPGRSPDIEQLDTLRWIGRFLGRCHAQGAKSEFKERLTLGPDSLGWNHLAFLEQSDLLPEQIGAAWLDSAKRAMDAVQDVWDRQPAMPLIRTHGDCHLGNILWSEQGPHFVDLDDAMMAPAVQDLWMLTAGDPDTQRRQRHALMDGYETFLPFDDEQWQWVEALRTLRLIHHSAWLAKRWHDPAFPAAFPWFASPNYWEQQAGHLREQTAAMKGRHEHD